MQYRSSKDHQSAGQLNPRHLAVQQTPRTRCQSLRAGRGCIAVVAPNARLSPPTAVLPAGKFSIPTREHHSTKISLPPPPAQHCSNSWTSLPTHQTVPRPRVVRFTTAYQGLRRSLPLDLLGMVLLLSGHPQRMIAHWRFEKAFTTVCFLTAHGSPRLYRLPHHRMAAIAGIRRFRRLQSDNHPGIKAHHLVMAAATSQLVVIVSNMHECCETA